jgi:segregation and condensation protein B
LQKAEKRRSSSDVVPEHTQAEEKAQNDLALVEAALYVAGRPLDLNELCSVLKTRSKNKARKLAKTLMQDYAKNHVALEVLELKDERYVLQLKADYTPLVKRLVNRPLLSAGPLKTLSYVAYRQPVSQKRVIDVRGHHAYGHIKMLREMGLIAAERSGRSTLLRTTDYFADYFALSHDAANMKRELKNIFQDFAKQENTLEQDG